jgi:hypothetical protein
VKPAPTTVTVTQVNGGAATAPCTPA